MNFIASTLGRFFPKHRTLAEWAKTYSLVVQAKPIQAKTKQNRASHIRRIVNRLGDSATTQGFGACAVGHGLPQLVVGWRSDGDRAFYVDGDTLYQHPRTSLKV